MQRAKTPNQIDRVNPNHRTIGDQLTENPQRHSIVWIVERWNQDCCIRNVEICIARRQSLAVEYQWLRHWYRNKLYLRPVFEPHRLQPLDVLFKDGIIVVVIVLLATDHHGGWVHKPTKIVDMPVRVITGDAFSEPQHVSHTEVVSKRRFHFFTRETRVPHLNLRIEQAFLGRDQSAPSVYFDGAPFQNEIAIFYLASKHSAV